MRSSDGSSDVCSSDLLLGTDLNLEGTPLSVGDHGMQGTIAIGLGPRYIVVKFIRDRRPQRMCKGQNGIAGALILDNDAQRSQIEQLAEIYTLIAHLVPDAVDKIGKASCRERVC